MIAGMTPQEATATIAALRLEGVPANLAKKMTTAIADDRSIASFCWRAGRRVERITRQDGRDCVIADAGKAELEQIDELKRVLKPRGGAA